MRRIVIWLASTVTVVVLLFGYHTSTNSPAPAAAASSSASPIPVRIRVEHGVELGIELGIELDVHPAATTTTYTGDVAQTRWGPVQVAITVAAGKITNVDVVQHPDGNSRDQEINDYALPILVQDTLDAQSAKIDMISGATVTSDGYVTSLQSALDRAGI